MLGFDRYAIALNPLVDHHIPQKRGDMLGEQPLFETFRQLTCVGRNWEPTDGEFMPKTARSGVGPLKKCQK